MGVITDLIRMNHDKKQADAERHLKANESLLTLARLPEEQLYSLGFDPAEFRSKIAPTAIDNIVDIYGKNVGKEHKQGGGIIKTMLSGLAGLNPAPRDPYRDQQTPQRPQAQPRTQADLDKFREQRAEVESKIAAKQAEAEAKARAEQEEKKKNIEIQDRLDALDKDYQAGYVDTEKYKQMHTEISSGKDFPTTTRETKSESEQDLAFADFRETNNLPPNAPLTAHQRVAAIKSYGAKPAGGDSAEVREFTEFYKSQGKPDEEARKLALADYYKQKNKEASGGGAKGVLGELEDAERVIADPKATPAQRRAAVLFRANYQAGTTEKQINAATNAALASEAGIGTGSGGPSTNAAKPPTKVATGAPATNPIDQSSINEFIGRSLGTITAGRDKFTALRMRRGMQALMDRTGMSSEQLAASIQERKGEYKALNEAIQRYRAYQGLENRLVAHGDILKGARRALPDSKFKLLNAAVQQGLQQVSDPEVNKYLVAVNAVAREYATAISNGFQSRAMLPVSSSEEAAKIIAPSLGSGGIDAIVDQLNIEVKASEEAMKKQQADILTSVARPLGTPQSNAPPPQTNTNRPPLSSFER